MIRSSDYNPVLSRSKNPKELLASSLHSLKLNKKLFFSAFIGVTVICATVAMLNFKPNYVAEGLLVIKDSAVTAKYVTSDTYETTASKSTNSVINTMGLLRASSYMEKLFEYFQNTHPEELTILKIETTKDWQDYFEDGNKFINYSNIPGTDMINLSFKWSDALIAKEALEVVIEEFRNISLRLNQSEQEERELFLNDQIKSIQDKLVATRKQISAYKAKNGIINTAEENANLARARTNMKADLDATVAASRGKQMEMSGYQNLLGMNAKQAVTATAIGRNQSLANLYQELYRMRSEKNGLLTRYTEKSPKVIDLNQKIEQTQNNIKKELSRTIGKTNLDIDTAGAMAFSDSTRSNAVGKLITAKASVLELNARSRSIRNSLAALNARAKNMTQAETKLADMTVQEVSLEESLKTLMQKQIDAKLKKSQTLSNIFLIEAPRVPLHASFPKRSHLLVISVVLGLATGVAVVLIKQYFTSQTMLSPAGLTGRLHPELMNDLSSGNMPEKGRGQKNAVDNQETASSVN